MIKKKPNAQQNTDENISLLSDFLCFSLYSVNHTMNRTYKPLLKQLGLTYPQYIAMVTLWENDHQLVSDISKKLFLESNTVTPLLKRLESMGYVTRMRDSEDERKVYVTLTPSGKKLQKQATCIPSAILEASGLTEKKLKNLNKEIIRLRKNLIANLC